MSIQEERLIYLQQRLEVPFDGSQVEHQVGFIQFFSIVFIY